MTHERRRAAWAALGEMFVTPEEVDQLVGETIYMCGRGELTWDYGNRCLVWTQRLGAHEFGAAEVVAQDVTPEMLQAFRRVFGYVMGWRQPELPPADPALMGRVHKGW